MNNKITVGIIGDASEDHPAHKVTDAALNHAAKYLSVDIGFSWIPTQSLTNSAGLQGLEWFGGIIGAPGGAYQSCDGAVAGIQFAREHERPFLGT